MNQSKGDGEWMDWHGRLPRSDLPGQRRRREIGRRRDEGILSNRDAEAQGWFDFALADISFIERPHMVQAVIMCFPTIYLWDVTKKGVAKSWLPWPGERLPVPSRQARISEIW